MEALAGQWIARIEATKRNDTGAWKRGEPHVQPVYRYAKSHHQGVAVWEDIARSSATRATSSFTAVTKLCVMSWNIDFMLPFSEVRMKAAVSHLRGLVEKQREQCKGIAHAIFLAECVGSDLELLAAESWVQRNFTLTDLDTNSWEMPSYGTTMLVDRGLEVSQCFRVHFPRTNMQRDVLFVDVKMGEPAKTIRLCNTHLESLANNPPLRPHQMQVCAHYMHDPNVHGAVLAGDLNAIQPFDLTLHSDNGLKDAYLERGGSEDDADGGHTWGQQAATILRKRFGTTRMDKVLYCGGIQLESFERFGAGIEVDDEDARQEIVGLGFERPWITDHLGVKAIFEIRDTNLV